TKQYQNNTPFSFSLLIPSTSDPSNSDNQQERAAWRSLNNVPRSAGILRYVDVLTPSFLAVEEDPEAWVKRVRRSVEECRRVAPNHPIYPYLYFRYHPTLAPDPWKGELL